MTFRTTYALSALFGLVLLGCEQPFSPKGPFEPKLAAYGILSANADTQYVRLFKTYDPPGFNPYDVTQDQVIKGASVTVSQEGSIVQYQESMIPRTDTSRFGDNILAYAAYPFRARPGKTYQLSVVTPLDGNVSSSVSVPDSGWITVVNSYVLDPTRFTIYPDDFLALQGYISNDAYGFMMRFYIDFDVAQGNNLIRKRMEIPSLIFVLDTTRVFAYPKLVRRMSIPGSTPARQLEGTFFMMKAYSEKRKDILTQFGSNNVYFRRAIFVLTQVERNLYTYYNIVNGYQDPISIRTDQPDWTNISGGFGAFGAMREDSAFVDLEHF